MMQHVNLDFESLGVFGSIYHSDASERRGRWSPPSAARQDEMEDGICADQDFADMAGASASAATSRGARLTSGIVATVCVTVCVAGLCGLKFREPSVVSRRRLAEDLSAPVAWPQALEASSIEWPPHEQLADHFDMSEVSWPPFSSVVFGPDQWKESLDGSAEWPPRPVAPTGVYWPQSLQPDILACAPADGGRALLAFDSDGAGALVHQAGRPEAATFSLEGLGGLGKLRSATWGRKDLTVITTSGKLAACPPPAGGAATAQCKALAAPALPTPRTAPAAVLEDDGGALHVAVALAGRIAVLALKRGAWVEVAAVTADGSGVDAVKAITAGPGFLLATTTDGTAYYWRVRAGVPLSKRPVLDVPFVGSGKQRAWHSTCLLGDYAVVRLASAWTRESPHPEARPKIKTELLL